jgi:Pentapeptide repeats (8 copies)
MDGGAIATILAAVITAIVAAFSALGFQNRHAKLLAVSAQLFKVAEALASETPSQQMAAAILLRRFFDPSSELGIRNWLVWRRAPYAAEAVGVTVGVLLTLREGELQKVLADGLNFAPKLEGADLSRAKLCNAFLSPPRLKSTLRRADFFEADLSNASLRGAQAAGPCSTGHACGGPYCVGRSSAVRTSSKRTSAVRTSAKRT